MLLPPGISIWDTFPWKAPIPQQPVTTPSYRPPIGRGERLKTALSMRGLVPQVPQMAPAIRQLPLLPPSRPATPYQQAVQLPGKTSGLRVTFDSPASKPAPTGSKDVDVHGRQVSRGSDDDHQSASHPGRGPPSGRPVTGCLNRRVGTSPGRLIISLHPPPLESPHHSLVALRRLPLKTL